MENNLENLETVYTEESAVNEAELDGAVMDNVTEEAIAPEKKKPVGGIIAGIFNILFAIPAAIFCVASLVIIGLGIYFICDLLYGTHEGLEALGPAIMLIYTLYGIIIAVPAYFVLTLPSLPFFIAARKNHSKFFKVSTAVISIMHAIGCAIVILAIISYVIFWLIAKFR